MEKPPDKIFLQWDSGEFDPTWCIDKINDNDIPYIRKSIVAACERENAELKQHIAALESQLPRWISVEERLPEVKENDIGEHTSAVCQLNAKDKTYWTGYYVKDSDGWVHLPEHIILDANYVTHWMPLPSAPESEDE